MSADTGLTVRRTYLRPGLAIATIAIVGLALGLQGWRSRSPAIDMVPHITDAVEFVRAGRIPVKGTLSSFGVYTPPGVTWLLVPGVLVWNDPRLFEFAGTSVLHLGTLLGLFLIAQRAFGQRIALLTVCVYGLSTLGLFFATSLWPRGHPFFYVWFTLCLQRWIHARNTPALGAALVVWGVGMYEFMEIATAVLLVPLFWYLYRPPVRPLPIVAAVLATGLVWMPYLTFEQTRGFSDLRALLGRRTTLTAVSADDYRLSWCRPEALVAEWNGAAFIEPKPDSLPTEQIERGIARMGVTHVTAVAGTVALAWWANVLSNAAGNFNPMPSLVGLKFLLLAAALLAAVAALGAPASKFQFDAIAGQGPKRLVVAALLLGTAFATSWLPSLMSADGKLEAGTIAVPGVVTPECRGLGTALGDAAPLATANTRPPFWMESAQRSTAGCAHPRPRAPGAVGGAPADYRGGTSPEILVVVADPGRLSRRVRLGVGRPVHRHALEADLGRLRTGAHHADLRYRRQPGAPAVVGTRGMVRGRRTGGARRRCDHSRPGRAITGPHRIPAELRSRGDPACRR